jgi:dTDP-L-rhamnose 4-epimerase
MENILITGGAGFIGSNLALALLKRGYPVRVMDALSPQIHGDNPESSPLFLSIKDKVEFVFGDVRKREDWEKAIEGQDIIVHLAAETGTGQSMYEVEKYVDVNIKGTAILLDLLANKQHKVKKVVVASSRAIYGEGRYDCEMHGEVFPEERLDSLMSKEMFNLQCPYCSGVLNLKATHEQSKIHPTSIYGITKQNQEQMVLVGCKSLNIPAVAFRYQNVYGPGQSLSNPYTGILSIFSTRILNGNPINIFEDGKESRDFVYIDDVVSATILGIEKEESNNQVFNVGTGVNISVLHVVESLMKHYKKEVNIDVSGNYRLGDIRHNYADLEKINKLLGYTPSITFDEGVSRFTKWVESQEVQRDSYNESIEEMKKKGLFK